MNRNFKYTLIVLLLTCWCNAFAQPKSGYYNKIDGKKKEALKTAIKSIIVNHTKITYGKALEQAYESVYYRDDDRSYVYDMFSNDKYKFSASGWNKEHVVANSWWGGTKNNAYSDIFSVIPSESGANSRKSNYPLGEVKSVKWTNDCIKIGTAKDGQGGSYGTVFEPADQYKGDFARIYFYVATCYDDINWGSNSNSPSEIKKETWPTLKPWLYEMLLRWHNADPVSAKEIQINNSAEKEQGNRNPFIDYPALADYIWNKDYYNTSFNLSTAELYKHIDGSVTPTPPTPPDTTKTDTTGGGGGGDIPPVIDTDDYTPGDLLFAEYFDDIVEGNDNETGGSSKAWDGNDNFPTLTAIYQAGGIARMGSSKKTGQLLSCSIDCETPTNLFVEFDIKGWSDADAIIEVTLGGVKQQVKSTRRLGDEYENVRILFKDVAAPVTLEIVTTSGSKRCFIDNIEVREAIANPSTRINSTLLQILKADNDIYDLQGRKVKASRQLMQNGQLRGLYIRNGKKILLR